MTLYDVEGQEMAYYLWQPDALVRESQEIASAIFILKRGRNAH